MAKHKDGYNVVKGYPNLSSTGTSETFWRLFKLNINTRIPAVQALSVHHEGEQYITFKEGQKQMRPNRMPSALSSQSTLPSTQSIQKLKSIMWTYPRTLSGAPTDGINDREGIRKNWRSSHISTTEWRWERPQNYPLLRPLHWATCIGDLLTVNNVIHDTHKTVCRTLGLLQVD